MNPLIHINYRIWTLWTPDYWWSNWSPESCAKGIPLFTLPITFKKIVYRFCYHVGAYDWVLTTHITTHSHWEIDLGFDCRDWVDRQTS